MKIRLKFNHIIFMGLILLSAVIIHFSSAILKKVSEKEYLNKKIADINHPSTVYLNELYHLYSQSKNLIHSCIISGTRNDSLFRENYKMLFISEITGVLDKLTGLSVHWEPDEQEIFTATSLLIRDSLVYACKNLISAIHQDKMLFPETGQAEKSGEYLDMIPFFQKINDNLKYLLNKQQQEIAVNSAIIRGNSEVVGKMIRYFSLAIILLFIILFITILFYSNELYKKFNSTLEKLSQGIIPPKIVADQSDLAGKGFVSLNKLIDYLNRISLVLKRILHKDFDSDFAPAGADDIAGNLINDIRVSLKLTNEEQQRHQKEEFERNWTAEASSRINEILRKSTDKPAELGYKLIKKIVEYTGSRAGAIFVVTRPEEGESFIEMLASCSLDRKKQQEKKLATGEGLIGRCLIENKTLCLTDVPKGYLRIKSGMGESDPVSLLIVPLNLDDQVYGVIELASFSHFDAYIIKFVEKTGETIASALSKLEINLRTARLLEHTKAQTEQLTAGKQEMQKNIEELRITKELLAQKEDRLKKEIEILRRENKK